MNNEMYSSDEMRNAISVPPSMTYYELPKIDTQNLKDEIKKFLVIKDSKLLGIFENAYMCRINKSSGNENIKNLLHLVRDLFALKFMFLALETMMINNIDCSADEINALILGYISKSL